MPLEYALQHRNRFPDPGPWRQPESRPLELTAPLGLDSLPEQRRTKSRRTSFGLNLMVVGESGLGKTTFMNTLFNTNLREDIQPRNLQATRTVGIVPNHYELVEGDVAMNLCVVDTPGFGDELNREHNLSPILEYMNKQLEDYMVAERKPGFRRSIADTRIHAILYFISPTGHGMKELDLKALKSLSTKANVIPIIAKADTMTAEEKRAFKRNLLQDMNEHRIRTFPSSYLEDAESAREFVQYIPFSVIGSDKVGTVGDKQVRCRTYRWGIVEVENPEHSDFVYLRELIMSACLDDLVEMTHRVHYHAFRARAMRVNGRPRSILECDDLYDSTIRGRKQRHQEEMARREEEIRETFTQRVKDKETSLQEREDKLAVKKAEMEAELDRLRAMVEAEQQQVESMAQLSLSRSGTLSKTTSRLFKSK